eukprot:CAMPEP_0119153600 /NCGR_PEP_ID=MMETSP1310-20130426/49493_1 /TAXON_ID=464262 /ORGANISM="Genus nov. species nov., Strain RCC2339" /LENGTH=194 /DNA_ID=CAMNT_0007146063 /DNA_START=282 /DNA_END=863 /DNA_ORIENTATION=-
MSPPRSIVFVKLPMFLQAYDIHPLCCTSTLLKVVAGSRLLLPQAHFLYLTRADSCNEYAEGQTFYVTGRTLFPCDTIRDSKVEDGDLIDVLPASEHLGPNRQHYHRYLTYKMPEEDITPWSVKFLVVDVELRKMPPTLTGYSNESMKTLFERAGEELPKSIRMEREVPLDQCMDLHAGIFCPKELKGKRIYAVW